MGLGQAKIGYLGLPFPGHQHVQRLDVLVHQSPLVCCLQAPGKLDRHIEHLLQTRQPAIADPFLQRPSFDILGKDHHLIVDGAEEPAGRHVRMLRQIDPSPQFAQERLPMFRLSDQRGQDSLDGKPLTTGSAADQVDVAHAAAAKKLFDFIQVEDHVARLPDFRHTLLFDRGCNIRPRRTSRLDRRDSPGFRLHFRSTRPLGIGCQVEIGLHEVIREEKDVATLLAPHLLAEESLGDYVRLITRWTSDFHQGRRPVACIIPCHFHRPHAVSSCACLLLEVRDHHPCPALQATKPFADLLGLDFQFGLAIRVRAVDLPGGIRRARDKRFFRLWHLLRIKRRGEFEDRITARPTAATKAVSGQLYRKRSQIEVLVTL